MRIGDVNQSNYADYLKMSSGNKNTKLSLSKNIESSKTAKQPIDPSSYIEDGFDITGRTDWKKTVDVSDEIKDKVINIMRKDFINNYGMTDGEEFRTAQKKYVLSLPASERASAIWTLDRIFGEEGARLGSIVKEKMPNWQVGQAFDRSILTEEVTSGIFNKQV